MHPEYALVYRELYEQHWWWRAREDLILETIGRLSGGAPLGPILDVGCGDGLLFEKLAKYGPVEGVEMDPTGVNPGGPWVDRIHVRPFDESFRPGKRYALVLMLDVLEHFADPVASLRRAVELLEEGGAILLTVPAFPALWTSHDVLNRHFVRFTRKSLEDVAERTGARIESSRYVFQWMSPLKLAVAWKERVFPASPRPPRVPPRFINRGLYRLSRLEHRLLGSLSLPFGSSLLAIVRRSEAERSRT